jgi:hypothetical protein
MYGTGGKRTRSMWSFSGFRVWVACLAVGKYFSLRFYNDVLISGNGQDREDFKSHASMKDVSIPTYSGQGYPSGHPFT